MHVDRALVILLIAATLVAVSGCLEFGEIPDAPAPTPTVTPAPTIYITPAPTPQVPSTQVSVALKNVSQNLTADGQQSENLVLTLKNTGTTDVTDVSLSYKEEDPVAREVLRSGSISAGSISAGGQTDVTVSVPRYTYLNAMNFSAAVSWGNDPAFVNNETRPWSISLR